MIRLNLLPASQTVWSIYRLTSPSGKVYIGQTVKSVARRWSDHCSNAKQEVDACPRLEAAVRKYGREAFKLELLFAVYSQEEADRLEIDNITSHDSCGVAGYNVTAGGLGHSKERCKREHLLAETRNSVGACGECARLRNKEWEEAHRDEINAKSRQEYKDPDIRARRKAAGEKYRAHNQEKLREDSRTRLTDPDRLAARHTAANKYARKKQLEIDADPVAREAYLAKRLQWNEAHREENNRKRREYCQRKKAVLVA